MYMCQRVYVSCDSSLYEKLFEFKVHLLVLRWTGKTTTLLFSSICIYSKGKIYNSINIVATTLAKTSLRVRSTFNKTRSCTRGKRRRVGEIKRTRVGRRFCQAWDHWRLNGPTGEVTLKVHQYLWYSNSLLIALLRRGKTQIQDHYVPLFTVCHVPKWRPTSSWRPRNKKDHVGINKTKKSLLHI